jgi:unsaturated rhamnogalacturonyl hydrolase
MRVDGGLYRHGWDESREQRWADPKTGLSPHVWGRAMGWFMMALVDCLELHADATLRSMFIDAARALVAMQRPSALWQQVVEAPERDGNYEEASASLMIAYALMKGARLSLLDAPHGEAGRRAFKACVERFLSATELSGICGVAGLGGNPYRDGSYGYYLSEPIIANDPKGVGAFLMALTEAAKTPPPARGS